MINRFPAAAVTTPTHLSISPARQVTLGISRSWGRTHIVDGAGVDGAYETITEAIAAASAHDRLLVKPGAYDESVVVDKALTIECLGNRGSAFIEPSTAEAFGMQVTADDVTLINIGVAGDSAAAYALNIHAASRFRAFGCKFEGPDLIGVLMDGTDDGQASDVLLDDCEYAWCGSAIVFDASSYGVPTQIFLNGGRFHNIVTAHLAEADGDAWVVNLNVIGTVHDRAEDGTAPTKFIEVDHADSTGVISGARFAYATNEADVIDIGAKILYVANMTEAGITTARPS